MAGKPKTKPKKTVALIAFGNEPEVPAGIFMTQGEMVHALNWYNYQTTLDMAEKFISTHMATSHTKAEIASGVALVRKWRPTIIGLMRMDTRGFPLSDSDRDRIRVETARVLALKSEAVDDEAPVVAKAPKAAVPLDKFTEYLESAYAKALEGEATANVYADLNRLGCTVKIAARLQPYFVREKADFQLILEDEEYAKALSHVSPRRRKSVMAFFESVEKALGMFAAVKKAASKPRVVRKKAVKLDKLVARCNYKRDCKETKLTSIDPIKVIGANELWVYNTKYKMVYVAVAATGQTLSIKGSTLTGFGEEKTHGKKLRKPEVSLPNLIGGKVSSRREFDNLKTVLVPWAGRLNEHTILLKVH